MKNYQQSVKGLPVGEIS